MAEVVSSFELIFKPQSPADPDDGGPVATVIQGYFLSISNLEDADYSYSLRFVIADPGDPNRTLEDNTLVIIDSPSGDPADNRFTRLRSSDGKRFFPASGAFTVPAHGTALVAVLPQVFGPVPGDDTPLAGPDFEVRGYVEIRLPALFGRTTDSPFGRFVQQAQSDGPVRVLLTPQYRASYLDADGAISDQTQATVPLAGGAGVVEIEPDRPFAKIPFEEFVPRLPVGLIEELDEREKSALLAALLGAIDAADALDPVNDLLKTIESPITLRKGD